MYTVSPGLKPVPLTFTVVLFLKLRAGDTINFGLAAADAPPANPMVPPSKRTVVASTVAPARIESIRFIFLLSRMRGKKLPPLVYPFTSVLSASHLVVKDFEFGVLSTSSTARARTRE
jgi:hypothetical protein